VKVPNIIPIQDTIHKEHAPPGRVLPMQLSFFAFLEKSEKRRRRKKEKRNPPK